MRIVDREDRSKVLTNFEPKSRHRHQSGERPVGAGLMLPSIPSEPRRELLQYKAYDWLGVQRAAPLSPVFRRVQIGRHHARLKQGAHHSHVQVPVRRADVGFRPGLVGGVAPNLAYWNDPGFAALRQGAASQYLPASRSIRAIPISACFFRLNFAGVSVRTTSKVGRTLPLRRWPPRVVPSHRPSTT